MARREVSLEIIYPAVYCWGAIPCWCVLMRTRQLFHLAATSRVICVRYWLYRGIGSREFRTHVCAKRQTWICAAWPSFTLNCRLLFITSTKIKSSFTPVLSVRIVMDRFYLFMVCSEKFSTWISRLPFVVNVTRNLSSVCVSACVLKLVLKPFKA